MLTGTGPVLASRLGSVDIFIWTDSRAEATRICRAIYFALALDDEIWLISRAKSVINLTRYGRHDLGGATVQIVLRLYDSPAEILLGFDVDCACCGFDGAHVWALPRCIRALKTGVNVLNPLHAWPNRATYEYRLCKYASRGFAVAVPGLEQSRVDWLAINATELSTLRGLSRLLKLVLAASSSDIVRKGWGGSIPSSTARLATRCVDPLVLSCVHPVNFLSEADIEVKALHCGSYDDDRDIIYPSVFFQRRDGDEPAIAADGIPRAGLAMERRSGMYIDCFHVARDTRLLAWAEISDAGQAAPWTNARVARKLDDAWDDSKRSREYLNAAGGELEPRYYVHAYMPTSSS